MQFTSSFFHQVNFLAVVSPPEVDIAKEILIVAFFGPLDEQIILPKLPDVGSNREGVKVINESVSDPIIPEIIAVCFGDFFSLVAAEAIE